MKKCLVIFVITSYLASALGVDLNIHFCKGKLDSIEFASNSNAGCKCQPAHFFKPGLSKREHSCCSDFHFHSGYTFPFENERDSSFHCTAKLRDTEDLFNLFLLNLHSHYFESEQSFKRQRLKNQVRHCKIPKFISLRVLRL